MEDFNATSSDTETGLFRDDSGPSTPVPPRVPLVKSSPSANMEEEAVVAERVGESYFEKMLKEDPNLVELLQGAVVTATPKRKREVKDEDETDNERDPDYEDEEEEEEEEEENGKEEVMDNASREALIAQKRETNGCVLITIKGNINHKHVRKVLSPMKENKDLAHIDVSTIGEDEQFGLAVELIPYKDSAFFKLIAKKPAPLKIRKYICDNYPAFKDLNKEVAECKILNLAVKDYDTWLEDAGIVLGRSVLAKREIKKQKKGITMHAIMEELLKALQLMGARRRNKHLIYVPRFTTNSGKATTIAYRLLSTNPDPKQAREESTLEYFVYQRTGAARNQEFWEYVCNSNAQTKLVNNLTKVVDPRFPDLVVDRYLFAFNNGIYSAMTDSFHLNGSVEVNEWIRRGKGAVKFFDRELNWEAIKNLTWDAIQTPNYEKLFSVNFPDKQVQFVYTAMHGRLFYEIKALDKWDVFIFHLGASGSGKSTIMTLMKEFYDPGNVGTFDNDTEKNFALEPWIGKLLGLGSDVDEAFAKVFQATQITKMSGGEQIDVKQKCKTALTFDNWTIPFAFAGNGLPAWYDDSKRIDRRIVVFYHTKPVPRNQMISDFDKKLQEEAPLILVKMNRAYLKLVNDVGAQKALFEHLKTLTPYFDDKKEELVKELSPFDSFMNDKAIVSYDKSYWFPWVPFHDIYQMNKPGAAKVARSKAQLLVPKYDCTLTNVTHPSITEAENPWEFKMLLKLKPGGMKVLETEKVDGVERPSKLYYHNYAVVGCRVEYDVTGAQRPEPQPSTTHKHITIQRGAYSKP